jgi:hypothetical protein
VNRCSPPLRTLPFSRNGTSKAVAFVRLSERVMRFAKSSSIATINRSDVDEPQSRMRPRIVAEAAQSIGSGKAVELRSRTGGGESGFSSVKTAVSSIEPEAGSVWSPQEKPQ